MITSPSSTDSLLDPSTDLLVQARRWAERGYQYQQRSEFTKAVICYSEAIQLLPQLDNVYACRATCYFQLADYNAAVADFSVEIASRPNDWSMYRKRALAYIKLGKYEVAIVDLELVRRSSITLWQELCRLPHASALFRLGIEQSQAGELDAAITNLTESMQMAPEAAEGIKPRLMALHERRMARDRESEENLQIQRQAEARRQSQIEAQRQRELAARRQAGIEAYVHYNRAIHYMDHGENDMALTKFNEALRYDPSLIDAHVYRAQMLHAKAQQLRLEQTANPTKPRLVHMQRLLRSALDSYNQALQLGLELIQINSARRTTRLALMEVEREIEIASQQTPNSPPPTANDTDQVVF